MRKWRTGVGFLSFVLLLAAAYAHAPGAHAQQHASFFVDSAIDPLGRQEVVGEELLVSKNGRFFVDRNYFQTLSVGARANFIQEVEALAEVFDEIIYPKTTFSFGLPWTPGIDGDTKIAILFIPMEESLAGYVRGQDELPQSRSPQSNERELIFLSTAVVGSSQAPEFLAHELQHVILNNTKARAYGVEEEVWLNEMLSEMTPSIIGLVSADKEEFQQTSAYGRLEQFKRTPGESFVQWENTSEDYAAVHMFGQYALGRFGPDLFLAITRSPEVGRAAFDDALKSLSANTTFAEVFVDWAIANVLNDCTVPPRGRYCYASQNLRGDNFRIAFNQSLGSGTYISSEDALGPWEVAWSRYKRALEETRPDDHVLVYEFVVLSGPQDVSFPVIIFPKDGVPVVRNMITSNGVAEFFLEGFGESFSHIVAVPVYLSDESGALPLVFRQTVSTHEDVPERFTLKEVLIADVPQYAFLDIQDGALVRAKGNERVYIINGVYKRWIQAAEIIDMYGHLRWEDVQIVAPEVLAEYQESNVVRFGEEKRVYQVSASGTKMWIQTEAQFLNLGYAFSMVYEINERELNWYR